MNNDIQTTHTRELYTPSLYTHRSCMVSCLYIRLYAKLSYCILIHADMFAYGQFSN